MAHSRIEPFLIDLNPQEIIKVFTVIENFTNLNDIGRGKVENFKNLLKDKEFSPLEKYIIIHYVIEYFNTENKLSETSKYILKLQKSEETEEFEDIEGKDLKYRSLKYVSDINDVCIYNRDLYKRKAISQLKTGNTVQFSESDLELNNSLLIPLPFYAPKRITAFKEKAFEIFGGIFSQEIVIEIINNSFKTLEIEYKTIQLLNIQFENSTDINSSFFLFYKAYKAEINHICKRIDSISRRLKERMEKMKKNHKVEFEKNIILLEQKYPEKIEKIKSELCFEQDKEIQNQKKTIEYYSKKNKEFKKAKNKTNVARVMFMSFPQIRYNYLELNNKKKLPIEAYLKIVSRNIRRNT